MCWILQQVCVGVAYLLISIPHLIAFHILLLLKEEKLYWIEYWKVNECIHIDYVT